MLKALTFIGSGPTKYKETTYYIEHDGKRESCKTHLFPEVVVELYQPTELIAFATDEVLKDIHGQGYLAHLSCVCSKHAVGFKSKRIASGKSTNELWEIFNVYADAVDEGDKIILDITHGFRSLPVLALPAIAYLSQVKSVEFKHILYGAFEARDEDQTPIFDLTPFVTLLDWTNAVKIFQHSGDARLIAQLCKVGTIPKALEISETLTNMSDALLTNLPLDAQQAAFGFDKLHLHQEEPSQAPFGILIRELKGTYKDMAVDKPHDHLNDSLNAQYKQIEWYIENLHYFQAITLVREWLVSWECQRAKPSDPDWLNGTKRSNANKRLNESTKNYFGQLAEDLVDQGLHVSLEKFRKDCQTIRGKSNEKFVGIDLHLTATTLWEDCKIIRNRLAHCGMSQTASMATQTFQEISQEVQRLSEEIKHLQEIYGEFIKFQDSKNAKEISRMQREQIEWYICNEHYLHAITLIRECLIHWERHRDLTLPQNNVITRLNNRKKKENISGKLWKTCCEIQGEFSNLEESFQTQPAEEAINKIKTFCGENGLKRLII